MKILLSGASGLVGTRLYEFLAGKGHTIKKLVRKKHLNHTDEIFWDPMTQQVKVDSLEGVDVFINLAGENIAKQRWSKERKKEILESRINATKTLTDAVLKLKNPPKLFINASAVGYYGNAGETLLNENFPAGNDFLAKVCVDWEAAAKPVESKNVRLVFLRFGMVLSGDGGALKAMLTPFKLGVGGALGTGQQYMSWVDLEDLVNVVQHVLENEDLKGPFNVVSPNPVSNQMFTKTLGKVLNRPTLFSIPTFMVKLIFGEMGEELLLASQKCVPEKLQESGYQFKYSQLEDSLQKNC